MVGRTSPQSRKIANIRLQLKTGMTRGPNPRPLTGEEINALKQRHDVLAERIRPSSRIMAHTTVEIDRSIDAINTHTSKVVKQALCPDIATDATAEEELDALRARQRATQSRMGVLRTAVAKKKKEERDDRPTRKLL